MTVCWRQGTVIALAVFMAGCFSGHKPLDVLTYKSRPQNENLIVFMRGMGGSLSCPIGSHSCFEKEGFVAAVRSRGLPFDMVAPNAHFGYYMNRTLEMRIREDILAPARAAGYKRIWLVGVSMGGLGSLLYLRLHPEEIDGVLILGPFLGDKDIIEEIISAGGPASWEPGAYDPDVDWQRLLWDWLKAYPHSNETHAPIHIGIGREDQYFTSQMLLADFLPPGRTIVVDGKHRLSTFKTAWDAFLDLGLLK